MNIHFCSRCQAPNPSFLCTCTFPLPAFCSPSCYEKHTSPGEFHFKQPLTASSCITAENYTRWKTWFFQLDMGQKAVKGTLDRWASFENDVETVFTCIERELDSLKKEWLDQGKRFREELERWVNKAIDDTYNTATCRSPLFDNPVSTLLWTRIAAENTANLLLYEVKAVPASREEIMSLCGVTVTKLDQSLPDFPLKGASKDLTCRYCAKSFPTPGFCSPECQERMRAMRYCKSCNSPILTQSWSASITGADAVNLRIPVEFCSSQCFYARYGPPLHPPVQDTCVNSCGRAGVSRLPCGHTYCHACGESSHWVCSRCNPAYPR